MGMNVESRLCAPFCCCCFWGFCAPFDVFGVRAILPACARRRAGAREKGAACPPQAGGSRGEPSSLGLASHRLTRAPAQTRDDERESARPRPAAAPARAGARRARGPALRQLRPRLRRRPPEALLLPAPRRQHQGSGLARPLPRETPSRTAGGLNPSTLVLRCPRGGVSRRAGSTSS